MSETAERERQHQLRKWVFRGVVAVSALVFLELCAGPIDDEPSPGIVVATKHKGGRAPGTYTSHVDEYGNKTSVRSRGEASSCRITVELEDGRRVRTSKRCLQPETAVNVRIRRGLITRMHYVEAISRR